MTMVPLQLAIVCLLVSTGPATAYHPNVTEQEVLKHIFEDKAYDKNIRFHNKTATNVTIGLSQISLDNVDIVGGKITIRAFLRLGWKDERLAWNPAENQGLSKITLDRDQVWMPDISVYNHVAGESAAEEGPSLPVLKILAYADGSVMYIPSHSYTVYCDLDPSKSATYSNRNCEIKFGSWAHDGFQINVLVSPYSNSMSDLVQNKVWELISVKSRRENKVYECCPEPYPNIIFNIEFRLRMDKRLGVEVSNERRLYHYLVDDYVPDVMPVPKLRRNTSYDYNDPMITVGMYVGVLRVTGVDFKTHTMVSTFLMLKRWVDEELAWDPAHFGGINKTEVPSERVWKPAFMIANRAEEWYDMNNEMHVQSNGQVRWGISYTMRTFCTLDVYRFPYDSHTCFLWIISYRQDASKLGIKILGAWGGGKSQFLQEGLEWNIDSVEGTKENWKLLGDVKYPAAQIVVKISRRSTYYTHVFTAPCVLLAFLTPVVFLLPTSAPEKVTLGIGIFVSLTLLLEILEDNMFAASSVPIIALYYVATMVLTAFSILMSTIILNVVDKGKKDRFIPKVLRVIFLNVLGRILRVTPSSTRDREMVTFNELENHGDGLDGSDVKDDHVHITHGGPSMNEWFTLAAVIDRLFFLTFLVVATICSIAMFASG
ncbi:neuronal acetylcholine receptor subunit beta-3-like [Lingula anatina]|uniref:Neuronal acetylcholine receptor subunit beta-3-like n=1 Tax=Lingula anatina TaxID=7574 RepID=A0A1S3JHH2_LINAN|nr:neuronal acetylcholine receptor subunit beta-3-like [Lingula anatina]|eukprot:XP_013409349.1 neuronal acetylcholine receptor subunit beta-3-like [Lingula anatina]